MLHKVELPNGQELFRLIEVCRLARVQPGILRYWGTQFEQIETWESDSGELFYHRDQVEVVLEVRHLLMNEHLSIDAIRKRLTTARWSEPVHEIEGIPPERENTPAPAESGKTSDGEWRALHDPEIHAEVQERLAPLLSMVHGINARAASTFGIHDTWH